MKKLQYALYFAPLDNTACFSQVTEEEVVRIQQRHTPELIQFFKGLHVVDSEEWVIIADNLETAKMNLFARWVLYLSGRFEDSPYWFGDDTNDEKQILTNHVNYWIDKAKILLFHDVVECNQLRGGIILMQLLDA